LPAPVVGVSFFGSAHMTAKVYLIAFLAGALGHLGAIFVGFPLYFKIAAPIETYGNFFNLFFSPYAAAASSILLDGILKAIAAFVPFVLLLGCGLAILFPSNRMQAARFAALSLLLCHISIWLWQPVPFFNDFKWAPIAWFAEEALIVLLTFIGGSFIGIRILNSRQRSPKNSTIR